MGRSGRIYRKVRSRFLDKPTFFTWVEDRTLSASGLPSSEKQVEWLARNGVKTILSLTETPLPKEWLERNRITGVHIPMEDHRAPSVGKLNEAVAFVKTKLKNNSGDAVHVHCLAGKGRTGMVLACVLSESRGVSIGEAMKYLRGIRPGSVEYAQERFLLEYEKNSGKKPRDNGKDEPDSKGR